MGRKIIETHSLTRSELEILHRVSTDPFEFAKYIMLIHPTRGKVPFILYPYQKSVLRDFIKHKFNVILKFRQAGITELISLFCLWFAMYHPHKNVVIISIKDRVAKKVLRKIKFMYKNLPPFLRTRIVNGRMEESYGTASEMEFSNGSIIASIPTTEEAGRSEAVSLLVIDEAAIVRWAERIWAASWPTLSTGGRAIVNSTAYGVGNFFHKLFVGAVAGGNVFNPIRLHWQMHPERDLNWYREQAEILGPRKTAQEIDGDFLTSGNTVFDLADIKEIEDLIEEGYYDEEEGVNYQCLDNFENGLLRVFEHPKPNVKYTLGADIATGRSQDYSAFSIMDSKGDEKVCFKGKVPIDKMEKLIATWGRKYNRARVAPESNDIGLGVATNLQNNGYPNLYYSRSLLRKKGQPKPDVAEIPGWYTTKKNRPIIIAELEEDIRENNINIKDQFFCDEAKTFIYDGRNRPVAMNKDKGAGGDDLFEDEAYTDDSIFAKAITNFVRKQKQSTVTVLPG
jgi:hypothetical protein